MAKQKNNSIATSLIGLDSIIFFILAIRYLLSISEKSPNPFSNSIVIFFILAYLISDYFHKLKNNSLSLTLKKLVLILSITVLIFLPAIYIILNRHQTGNVTSTVDSAIQSETAAKYLLSAKNPYGANYEEVLKDWHLIMDGKILPNYGTEHYPYLPFYTEINSIAYLILNPIIGFFDLRMVSLLLLGLTLFLAFKIPKEQTDKFLFPILVAFNPLFLTSFLWGVNDIYVLFFILASAYLLVNRNLKPGLIFAALAIGIKHSAWPLVPFLLAFIYFRHRNLSAKNLIFSAKRLAPFTIIISLIFFPFLIWNFKAFIDDVWLFPNGGLPTSAAISGHGFAQLLLDLKIIGNRFDYFPFYIPQMIVILIWLPVLIYWQRRNNTVGQMLLNYLLFILPLWYFSRIFNYNYLAYLSLVATAIYFVSKKEGQIKKLKA